MNIKSGERIFNTVNHIMLIIVAIVAIYPIWYVLIASVSSPVAISSGEVILFPKGFNITAYKKLLDNNQIWVGYRNSILYTTVATLIDLFVQIPCAYALSQKRMPYRRFFMTLFIIPMYFSGGIMPTYLLLNTLGFVNSPLALIIPSCVNTFNLIVARSFFESNVPESLFDAAQIDGCGYTRFFGKIVLPLSKAVVAIIALYSIQGHWNAYLGPQMYLYSPELHTLQQVIRNIIANIDTGLSETATTAEIIAIVQEKQLLKYAVVVVSCLPLVIIYPFVQKFFVRGVMVGAVKG